MVDENWCVYIIRCKDNTLYTGISKDPFKRFSKHVAGTGSKYTRIHPPEKIEFVLPNLSHGEALKIEYQTKQQPKNKKIGYLVRR